MIRLIPLIAAGIAAGDIQFDWISLVDRWGIAGVMAFVAWALWRRDEARGKEQTALFRESIEAQISMRDELRKLIEIINRKEPGK